MKHRPRRWIALCLAGLMGVVAMNFGSARADDFYKGKTITLLIASDPGGGFDLYTRILAEYLPRYLPGNPTMISKNMTGAGGMTLLNWAYNGAPQDGTVIFTLNPNLPMQQRMGDPNVKYDASKIHAVGRLSGGNAVLFANPNAGVKSYKDLYDHEIIVGGSDPLAIPITMPTVAKNVLGLKMKIISGYQSQTQTKLAYDRGEIQAMTLALGSMYLTAPQLLKPGTVDFLFQIGFTREPEWADAPTLIEMAQKPEDRQLFEVMSVNMEIGRSFWVGPGVSEDRLKLLRTAFDKMLKDPEFLAEFKKENMLARFKSGADMDGYIKRLFDAPDSVIERLNDVMPKK